MGTRRRKPKDDLPLFDLPLRPGEDEPAAAERERVAAPREAAPVASTQPSPRRPQPVSEAEPSLFDASPGLFDAEPGLVDAGARPADAANASEALPDGEIESWQPVEAALHDRLLGGLLDLALNMIIIGLVVLIVRLPLGVPVHWDDWPAFAVLGLVFTFLYWTVPLAFWGQTPGMAWVGQAARSVTDEPLTFGQTVLRWVGSLLTVAFAGLPLLLVLFGSRSLSDRLSDSKTLEV